MVIVVGLFALCSDSGTQVSPVFGSSLLKSSDTSPFNHYMVKQSEDHVLEVCNGLCWTWHTSLPFTPPPARPKCKGSWEM